MSNIKYKFRDVGDALRKLRDFLAGSVRVKHGRFHPLLAPRSIPAPDIPRGPEYKYSNQYYYDRTAMNSVHPPVVARVALGLQHKSDAAEAIPGTKTTITFPTLPTPGFPYWWDSHCYYQCVSDVGMPKARPTPKDPPPPPPPPCPCPRTKTLKPPEDPCDPCNPQYSRQNN